MSQSLELFVDDRFEDQFRWGPNTSETVGIDLTAFMTGYFRWNTKTPDYDELLNGLLEEVIRLMLARQMVRDEEAVWILHDLITFLISAQYKKYRGTYLIYNP